MRIIKNKNFLAVRLPKPIEEARLKKDPKWQILTAN